MRFRRLSIGLSLILAAPAFLAWSAPIARAEAIYLRAGAGLGLLGDTGTASQSALGLNVDIGTVFATGMGWVATGSFTLASGTQGSSYAVGGGPTVAVESGAARLQAGAILAYAAYTPVGGTADGSLALGPKLNLDLGDGATSLSLGAQMLFVTGSSSFTQTTVTIGPKFSF